MNRKRRRRKRKPKCLVAGPWLGEFGWECFAWQAYVRAFSRNFDKTIIISQGNTEELYSDFADTYLEFQPSALAGFTDGSTRQGYSYNIPDVKKILSINEIQLSNYNVKIVLPINLWTGGWLPTEDIKCGTMGILKPEYVKLGIRNPQVSKRVVFAARNRQHRCEDNWKIESWQHLASQLTRDGYSIISIGTKTDSLHVPGTIDKRGVSFGGVIDILNECDFVFGTTSGGTHISFLCETPQVVWSKQENRLRNEIYWNPFASPILFLDKYSWHPPPDYVYEEFQRWRTKKNQK